MQKTISQSINFQGHGIHSGENVNITLKPASKNTGITFVRTDQNNCAINASVENLHNANRATILKNNQTTINTPEHLLAACFGLGIDNLIIEIDNNEVPIMDGSSKNFVEKLLQAGIKDLAAPKEKIIIKEPIIVKNQAAYLMALPCNTFKITFLIDYPETFIGDQIKSSEINDQTFINEIAPARTYGFYSEVKDLLEKNLAQGGTLENAVVVAENNYMNKLRFDDELVRHKILDLIGDLAIIGKPINGHFVGVKSGHALNGELVRELRRC
jgi:UDP-3-O-[3-hydroxymyristoyl] N-acetylglucosamine deacetylase